MTCSCSEDETGSISFVCAQHQAMVKAVVEHACASAKPQLDAIKAERTAFKALAFSLLLISLILGFALARASL